VAVRLGEPTERVRGGSWSALDASEPLTGSDPSEVAP
jgi:hypothetical protein